MEHKDQHYVPQCYLKPWCDSSTPAGQEPYVWRFSKDGKQVKRKPPRKIFFEKDMYTIHLPDGTRDLRLEHGLSELEGKYTTVRAEKLERDLPLDLDERLILSVFVAAMQARTVSQIDHVRGQWQQVLDLAGRMEQRVRESPEVAKAYAGVPSSGREIPIEHNSAAGREHRADDTKASYRRNGAIPFGDGHGGPGDGPDSRIHNV